MKIELDISSTELDLYKAKALYYEKRFKVLPELFWRLSHNHQKLTFDEANELFDNFINDNL